MLQKEQQIRKTDIVLIGLILAIAAGIFLCLQIRHAGRGTADIVVIRTDGQEIGRFALSEDAVIPLDTRYGHNQLRIEDGRARMVEADCPDGYCMEQAAVSKAGDVIVCLPHHLVVEAEEASGGEVDAVAF